MLEIKYKFNYRHNAWGVKREIRWEVPCFS
jgi:hypothetical protein